MNPSLSFGPPEAFAPEPVGSNAGPVTIELQQNEIASDYADFFDIRITGLLANQSVLVERFKVATSASGIDAQALLQRSYQLKDGAAITAGGVTNFNIPHDVEETEGEIVFQLDFFEPDIGNIAGYYIFRVSSANAAFSPATARLTITEAESSSVFRGTVVSNGQPVPYAMVGLLNPIGNYADFVKGTTADANGDYVLFAPRASEYDLVAALPNHVGDFGPGVSHFIDDNEVVEVNLELTPGTVTVSGMIRDASDAAIGVPGVELVFLSLASDGGVDDRRFSLAWTDGGGNFEAAVEPGHWGIIPRINSTYDRGYVNRADRPVAVIEVGSEDLTDVNVDLERGGAVIWGNLLSDSEINEAGDPMPLCGVEIIALNDDGTRGAWGITDGDGAYRLGVTPGDWKVFPFTYSLWESFYGGSRAMDVSIPDSDAAYHLNLSARPSAGDAVGFITDESNNPIGKLRLNCLNGDPFQPEEEIQMTYASDGFFSFALPAGRWTLFPDARQAAERQLLLRDLPIMNMEPLGEGEVYPTFEFPIVSVAPEAWVAVEILGSDGTPVVGIGVHGMAHIDGHQYDTFGVSDGNGVATLPALPGEWEFHASTNGLRAAGYTALDAFFVDVDSAWVERAAVVSRAGGAPPLLARPRFADFETLTIQGLGEPGQRYRIEGSHDVEQWTQLGHVIAIDGSFTIEQKITAGEYRRYFRAQVVD